MNCENLKKLISKASEMALHNIWDEKAFKINMTILKYDNTNFAACTRLAKYYKLNNNTEEAKKMYLKALVIDPNSQGVKNNLNEIQKHTDETKFVDELTTSKELFSSGQKLTQKGNYSFATRCYFKAFSMEPVLKHGVSLAKSYSKLGEDDKIRKLYKQLIESNPSMEGINNINIGFEGLLRDKKSIKSL